MYSSQRIDRITTPGKYCPYFLTYIADYLVIALGVDQRNEDIP